MTDEITSSLRMRMGKADAHYGGDLVDGARILQLFGDIVTEISIITDGDEGLLVGYEAVEFLCPVYVGDYVEATGKLAHMGNTSRTVEFMARKVIESRYEESASSAAVMDAPTVICRAVGTTVVPAARRRISEKGELEVE